jgi:hypothetical protein
MPSQATNYFYTMVAMGAVALMLTGAFEIHSAKLRAVSEGRELEKLLETIAAEAIEMIALVEATNATIKITIHTPQSFGHERYWIRLVSDSSESWIEGNFVDNWTGSPDFRVDLPNSVSASGIYEGGYGTLCLNCMIQGADIMLTIGRWEDS